MKLLASLAAGGLAGTATFAALYFTKSSTTSAAACGEQRFFGHIRELSNRGADYALRFDPATVTSGVTASDLNHGQAVPNDIGVVDESNRAYLYLVSSKTPVTVLTQATGVARSQVSVARLAQLAKQKHGPLDAGVYIAIHNDTVCSVEQQYRP